MNAPAPILRNAFRSNSLCCQPCCLASSLMRLRYSAGVSSLGGCTVSVRHSRLPSACAFSAAKLLLSAKPYSEIFCRGLRWFLFLCSGNGAPFTHAAYTAASAACRRCASSPCTRMVMLAGFSSSSNCMALRTCVCTAKFALPRSSIAHAIRLPSAALAATGVAANSSALIPRRLSTAASNSRCGTDINPSLGGSVLPLGSSTSRWAAFRVFGRADEAVSCASIASSKIDSMPRLYGHSTRKNYAYLPQPDAARTDPRHEEIRPHRHRHGQRVRLPDALQFGGRVSAGHHQEMPREIHHP